MGVSVKEKEELLVPPPPSRDVTLTLGEARMERLGRAALGLKRAGDRVPPPPGKREAVLPSGMEGEEERDGSDGERVGASGEGEAWKKLGVTKLLGDTRRRGVAETRGEVLKDGDAEFVVLRSGVPLAPVSGEEVGMMERETPGIV